ncbi:hypothetical protein PF010_g957 [Phytophthora fragariae]|uniref:Uncharacterized protein n=1 Tax=Phytophthora fragariae TaxID=53985 RepID=A0A6A4ES54_9STRA|nr:hypothetical protein PF003_g27971 [Phytophthora fragariae]KAE8949317.1 hypothetical protein PF009_g1131 [Phytophthora fragariae]KAE9138468.1 hypothetical protein PF010_g957 [Phytophthora fragariae]KAE9139559.1 hypothetical protein PF007_g980 [Phytophthora fragariae]KAE9327196.1 hypothetical protein PF001_g2047 [Phytophthora fragariae]
MYRSEELMLAIFILLALKMVPELGTPAEEILAEHDLRRE